MRLEFAGLQKRRTTKKGVKFAGLAPGLSNNSRITLNASSYTFSGSVTDTQTHTDTHNNGIYRASIASHGKNYLTCRLGSNFTTTKCLLAFITHLSSTHRCIAMRNINIRELYGQLQTYRPIVINDKSQAYVAMLLYGAVFLARDVIYTSRALML